MIESAISWAEQEPDYIKGSDMSFEYQVMRSDPNVWKVKIRAAVLRALPCVQEIFDNKRQAIEYSERYSIEREREEKYGFYPKNRRALSSCVGDRIRPRRGEELSRYFRPEGDLYRKLHSGSDWVLKDIMGNAILVEYKTSNRVLDSIPMSMDGFCEIFKPLNKRSFSYLEIYADGGGIE